MHFILIRKKGKKWFVNMDILVRKPTERECEVMKSITGNYIRNIQTETNNNTAPYENLQFFYHPDHIGSSNYITDVNGEVYQHLEYFPSGETFVEQRKNTEYTTYYFSGKELDTETGLYYFGARYYDPRTSIFLTVDPLMDKYPGVSSYAYCANNPVKLIDLDGLSPKPPRSRIEYRGNGIFGININSLNKATRQNYYNAGRNSNNWTTNSITGQKDIGISTTIAEIKINYTPISNIVGVKNTTVTTEAEKSNSTGLPDSRVKPRNINTVGSGAGTKGFGAFALGLNAVNLTYDYWNTFSLNGDMNAIENQKGLLQKSFEAVNMGAKYGLVPPQYQNKDDMGAITNFVFQGVNDTGNQDITTIGTDILKSMGRYDKNTNQVKPIIEE